MSSKDIITQCAPTLVGLKAGSIFNEHFDDKEVFFKEVSSFNARFKDKGINMIPLSSTSNNALLYVYRKKDLEKDFSNSISKELLTNYGYDSNNVFSSIQKLRERLIDKTFPHEIGLFLGFPPEDVKGFIDKNGQNYKSIGYWKVYGDEVQAQNTFNKYHIFQKILLDRLNKGFNLKQLVIQK